MKKIAVFLSLVAVLIFCSCNNKEKESESVQNSNMITVSQEVSSLEESKVIVSSKQDSKPTQISTPKLEKSLAELYEPYFTLGAAVGKRTLSSFPDLVKDQFNSLVCENAMKFESTERIKGVFTFDEADYVVNFAKENDMYLRGHTLVWHLQTPSWVMNTTNRDEMLDHMYDHIETVMTRYKGEVDAWDVVNEAVDDNTANNLRKSAWYNVIGEEYIELAFRKAKEIDPDALLFYNDYESMNMLKFNNILALVADLVQKDVPIDGVGIQAHWSIYNFSKTKLERMIKSIGELGLQVHLTEIDVSLYDYDHGANPYDKPPQELLDRQAQVYRDIFELCLKYDEYVTNVTTWGICDKYTWLDNHPISNRKDWPLIFDESGLPKKAYDEIVDLVLNYDPNAVPKEVEEVIIDFSNGTQGFKTRGGPIVVAEDGVLKVSGRKMTWHGAELYLNDILDVDSTYSFVATMKYDEGPQSANLLMAVNVNNTYPNLGAGNFEKGEWGEVWGEYTMTSDDSVLYFETSYKQNEADITSDDLIDFCIDKLVITKIA